MAALPTLFGRDVRRIHCVGVGGMGVGPLAIYLVQAGFAVSGEDDALTAEMSALLMRAGVTLGGMPADCDLLAYSSAIAATHPAYRAAQTRGIPSVRRGELLAEVTRDKKLVAVCGSHGKTTTTAMLITALRAAGFPAGYVLGGLFSDDSLPAAAGDNGWVVAEIDESDGTIERFSPEITVAVNLDWDHPDHYRQLADIEAAFAGLFRRTRSAVLTCDACAMSARVVDHLAAARAAGPHLVGLSGDATPASRSGRTDATRASRPQTSSSTPAFSTFGANGDFRGEVTEASGGRMRLRLGGRFSISEAQVQARGAFNAANATAALATAQLMGATLSRELLADFAAARRRQSVLHAGDFTVIEDYAHHPAEIRALLGSLRERVGSASSATTGRLVVVFQPHRYSRTAQFKTDFAAALAVADIVHLLDVYSAGEAPVAGGTTADVVAELRRIAPERLVRYTPADDAKFYTALTADVVPGDLVAFVGAGDIDKKAREWLVSGVKPDLQETARSSRAEAAVSVGRGLSPTLEGSGQTNATGTSRPQDPGAWDAFLAAVAPRLSAATKFKREEPLAAKTTMRVGGAARVYAEPASLSDLQTLLREAAQRGVPVFVLGRGSNLIVPDKGVDGLVLSLANEAWTTFEPREGGRVWAGAGLRLKNLCGLAAKAGLVGFEFLEGIPGSVGGALRMNAGAMGGWMFDVVEEVQLIALAGEVRTLPKAAMHVDYRHCAELHEAIALGALLRPASQADAAAVKRQMDAYARKRHESQPREPSAGCIFKNPPGDSAGRLIDQSGLKGERVGDAEVSPVHANFIVNRGHATSAQVLELVRRVRAGVRAAKGIDLQPEVLLYGQDWKDVL